jgi:rhodanese-related sulfurtransferase
MNIPAKNIKEISPKELAERLAKNDPFVVLDVRETWEAARVRLKNDQVVLAPLSKLAAQGVQALPETAANQEMEIVVVCHHGARSAQVTAWLQQSGWTNVQSLAGGLDAYARQIDPSIGTY